MSPHFSLTKRMFFGYPVFLTPQPSHRMACPPWHDGYESVRWHVGASPCRFLLCLLCLFCLFVCLFVCLLVLFDGLFIMFGVWLFVLLGRLVDCFVQSFVLHGRWVVWLLGCSQVTVFFGFGCLFVLLAVCFVGFWLLDWLILCFSLLFFLLVCLFCCLVVKLFRRFVIWLLVFVWSLGCLVAGLIVLWLFFLGWLSVLADCLVVLVSWSNIIVESCLCIVGLSKGNTDSCSWFQLEIKRKQKETIGMHKESSR